MAETKMMENIMSKRNKKHRNRANQKQLPLTSSAIDLRIAALDVKLQHRRAEDMAAGVKRPTPPKYDAKRNPMKWHPWGRGQSTIYVEKYCLNMMKTTGLECTACGNPIIDYQEIRIDGEIKGGRARWLVMHRECAKVK